MKTENNQARPVVCPFSINSLKRKAQRGVTLVEIALVMAALLVVGGGLYAANKKVGPTSKAAVTVQSFGALKNATRLMKAQTGCTPHDASFLIDDTSTASTCHPEKASAIVTWDGPYMQENSDLVTVTAVDSAKGVFSTGPGQVIHLSSVQEGVAIGVFTDAVGANWAFVSGVQGNEIHDLILDRVKETNCGSSYNTLNLNSFRLDTISGGLGSEGCHEGFRAGVSRVIAVTI